MVRILVVPERMLDLSHQLHNEATRLREIESRLGRALGGLDWQVRHQANVEGRVHAARQQAQRLAEQAEAMARFVSNRAMAFQEADRKGAEIIDTLPEVASDLAPSPVRDVADKVRELIDLGEFLAPAAAVAVIAPSMRPGLAYPGEVIINLPDWLRHIKGLREIREMVNLPGHFNHFNFVNLPSKILKWGVLFSIPTIIRKWAEDINEYEGTKLVSALIVDAILTLAPVGASFIASQIVVWLSALGTLLFPGLGTAAGFAVGTAIASLVSGVAASMVTQWAIDRYDVRERAIDAVDAKLRSVIDEIRAGFCRPDTSPALP